MDEHGIEWCDNNIDTIVGWLREEATNRRMPFANFIGKIIVRVAISNARRLKGKEYAVL
jgi:hypothetical protein